MRILGIDPSTYVGLALAEGDDVTGKLIHFPKVKGWPRLQLIAGAVSQTLQVWRPELVIIEAYAVGHASSVVTVIECGTFVRQELYKAGFRHWLEVPPSTLKKWTTGKGNAKKDAMARAVKERWGYESPSDDIVDAVALAKLGQAVFNGAEIQGVPSEGVRKWTPHSIVATS